MRWRLWLIGGLLLALVPLAGCARLNEWLEGTVGEKEKKEGPTPEEELANQKKALAGDVAADRKAAIGKLVGLKRSDALDVVLGYIADGDPAVVGEVLSNLGTVTGFAEKTEDERQLDPEGYNKQLAAKQQVLDKGLPALVKAVESGSSDACYSALIVLHNLTRPPVVPATAGDTLRQQASRSLLQVALAKAETDSRLLAIGVLASLRDGESIGQLVPLLASPDSALVSRTALALGQAAGSLGAAKADAVAKLEALLADPKQPDSVRSPVMLALGRLGATTVAGLDQPYVVQLSDDDKANLSLAEKQSPFEAYRTYALAGSKAAEAPAKLAEANRGCDKIAKTAEEELAAERKKGYR